MSDHPIVFRPEKHGVDYREIPGFPDYRIGDDGSIWSCLVWGSGGKKRGAWREMGGSRSQYVQVQLVGPRGRRRVRVHTIVLEVFVGPCPAGMETRHLNDVGTDNRLTNLVWGTCLANKRDGIRNGRIKKGSEHPCAMLDEKVVATIKRLLLAGRSGNALAKQFRVSRGTIYSIKYGQNWAHVKPEGFFIPH